MWQILIPDLRYLRHNFVFHIFKVFGLQFCLFCWLYISIFVFYQRCICSGGEFCLFFLVCSLLQCLLVGWSSSCFWFCFIFAFSFQISCFFVSALRVPRAVTRLTVYREPSFSARAGNSIDKTASFSSHSAKPNRGTLADRS